MNCEKYFDLIQDLLEDELDEYHTAKAEAHLLACQQCRERYETLHCAKEIYGQYLFDAEPPESWANFQARLVSENEQANGEKVTPASWLRPRQRIFSFSFSPATVALAALLFVCGIGFVWLQTNSVEKRGGKYVAEIETGNSTIPMQSNETNEKPATNSQMQIVAANDVPKNTDLTAESKSLKAKGNSLSGKKSLVAETLKINQKTASLNDKKKSASKPRPTEENRILALQAQNLETEIAGQMEKVELLLRSFRNARSNETIEGFDVEYEKRQARKLLDKNTQLKRSAENYGISYAEELFSRIEAYLLEIANLETNPSTDRVLDIKERVDNQNIIATLQAYSRDATQ